MLEFMLRASTHIDIKKKLKIKNILFGLNFYIAKRIWKGYKYKRVIKVFEDFNARFSAKMKFYEYRILNQKFNSYKF